MESVGAVGSSPTSLFIFRKIYIAYNEKKVNIKETDCWVMPAGVKFPRQYNSLIVERLETILRDVSWKLTILIFFFARFTVLLMKRHIIKTKKGGFTMKKFKKILEWTVAIATTLSGVFGIILLAKGKELPDAFWEK